MELESKTVGSNRIEVKIVLEPQPYVSAFFSTGISDEVLISSPFLLRSSKVHSMLSDLFLSEFLIFLSC